MSKKNSIQKKLVTFSCTSCNSKYELFSGCKDENVIVDICANCHPFYLGKTNMNYNLGPAEKLKDKFAKGKARAAKQK